MMKLKVKLLERVNFRKFRNSRNKDGHDVEYDLNEFISNVESMGELVDVPSFDELLEYRSIVYKIRDFQYAHIVYNDGEIVYNVVEPPLNDKLSEVLKTVRKAFDTVVNTDMILVDIDEKLKVVSDLYNKILDIFGIRLNEDEYNVVFYYLRRDYVGYGKIDPLMNDRYIEDISCNGPNIPVFIYHRFFESVRTNIVFNEVELNSFILRLAQMSGRHISILQPIRDASLPDGSRINMTLGREVTKKGSTFTIRKFRANPLSFTELVNLKTASAEIFAYLWILIEYKRSLLISGGTAAGKTTFLNAICAFIKPESKIVSIEDTPELNLLHPNWIQQVTRVGFGESGVSVSGVSGVSVKTPGDIDLYTLLVAALRQRPEYIIVGEVRGEEAYTLFQAISVGHAAMGTVHAASMQELLARLESPPMNVPRTLIANLDLVVFPALIRDGTRKTRRVKRMVEVLDLDTETKELVTNTVFKWNPEKDTFEFTGRSYLFEKIYEDTGIPVRKLMDEWKIRTKIIERLTERCVLKYSDVINVIRRYYINPDEVIAEVL